jgi:zinc-ribbon domain
MIYSGELPSGQKLYLENQGDATIVTVLMQQSGQQQQSSSSFVTGPWQTPPEIFASAQGAMIRVMTAAGVWGLTVQGMSLMVQSGAMPVGDDLRPVGLTSHAQMPQQQSGVGSFEMTPMQPMTPMTPMQPMTMGNMNMNANPMQMQMGNMGMSMGRSGSVASSSSQASSNASGVVSGNATGNVTPATTKTAKFCSQCGSGLVEGAKFCSSCGHQIA